MKKLNKNIVFMSGTYILGVIMFSVLITTALLVVKIPIGVYSLPLSCVFSAIACYFFSGRSVKDTLISVSAGLAFVALSIAVSCLVYDWSWDGNTYHKSMLALMEHGWNPFYETFYSYADKHFTFLSDVTATWYDAYPKGTEIWGACVYKLVGNIEAGKSFNILGTVASLLISFGIISEVKVLKKWQAGVCAALLCLNPVMLSQMFTYYNDGFLFQMVLICTLACLYLTFFENKKYTQTCYYIIFLAINIGFNIKFSSLIFFAFACGSLFVYWWVTKWKSGFANGGKATVIMRFIVLASSVFSGICLSGATSYVINTIRYRNPVYTMIGEGSTDIMVFNTPEKYLDMSNLKSFITSLFSKTTVYKDMEAIELKFPFTFDSSEFSSAMACDTRTGGWGVLFSGIFIISLVIWAFAFVNFIRKKSPVYHVSAIFAGVGIVTILFVPSMWWARYCVWLFYVPACAVAYLFYRANVCNKRSLEKIFGAGIIAALLILNMSPNIAKSIEIFEDYSYQQADFKKLKAAAETSDISVSCGTENKFYGRIFNLYDNGITNFTYDQKVQSKYTDKIFDSRSLYYRVDSGLMATDSLEKFVEYVKNKDDLVILISAKDEASYALNEKTIGIMQSLGLEFDLKNRYRYSYLAVIDENEVVFEKLANKKLYYTEKIDNKVLSMTSAGYENGCISSVEISGLEYSLNRRGLNIVVYDKNKDIVIDSIAVDTFKGEAISR